MNQRIRRGLEVIYWGVLAGLLAAGMWYLENSGMTKISIDDWEVLLLWMAGWINGGLLFFSGLTVGLGNRKMGIAWSLFFLVAVVLGLSLFYFEGVILNRVLLLLGAPIVLLVFLSVTYFTWIGLLFLAVRHRDYLSLRSLILLGINALVMNLMVRAATGIDWIVSKEFFLMGDLFLALGFCGLLWQGAYYLQVRKFSWAVAYGILGCCTFIMILMFIYSDSLQIRSIFERISQW